MTAVALLRGRERAAEQRPNTHHLEELRRDAGGSHRLRVSFGISEAERSGGHRGQAVERLLALPPIQVGLRGGRAAEQPGRAALVLENGNEPIVLVERKPAQHHGVDDGEDGRAGADAEGQDDQGYDSERR